MILKSKYLVLIFSLILFVGSAHAQKEGAIWYFGYGAGLDFTSHYPKPLTDGQLKTREGVATISDKDGNLLLYTDGQTIWNKLHQVMVNGTGLFGNVSSTQSSMVVPKPGSNSMYYIFTVDEVGSEESPGHGLHYSVVDINLNGGLGAVTQKNVDLTGGGSRQFTEKITAVLHDNNMDYWIIAHGWGNDNDKFFVYKLTKDGVSYKHSAVEGSKHMNIEDDVINRGAVGYLKSSPKGDYLAVAIESMKIFELFTFDNLSGEIDFLAKLPAGEEGRVNEAIHAAYGLEFSPTGNYFYGSTRKGGHIYRWKIEGNSESEIRRSMEVVYETSNNILCGALQLAFNGKIYVTFSNQQFLGVINSPTQDDCNFQYQGASLIDNKVGEGGRGYYGLPTFLPDFFKAAEFYYENTCVFDNTLFYLSSTYFLGNDPTWTIIDANGQTIGTAKTDAVTKEGFYQFTTPGTYTVRLDVQQNGADITQTQEVVIHPLPELNFPDTTSLCVGSSVDLDAGDGAFYNWSDNINLLERVRTVNREGTYSVTVTHNNGCISSDETEVVSQPLPDIGSIDIAQAACGYSNGSVVINTADDLSLYDFQWKEYPDSTGNKLFNLAGGVYNVDIVSTETGCVLSKKITISEEDAPPVVITPNFDGIICAGQEIQLTASGASNYIWESPYDSEEATITVAPMEETTYIVEGYTMNAEGAKCSAYGEITIEVFPYDPPELGSDRSVCEGTPLELDGGDRYGSWKWSNKATQEIISTEQIVSLTEGIDNLILTTTDINGCQASDTISLHYVPLPVIDLGNDRTVCFNAPIELDAGEAESYLWNTGDTTRIINIEESNIYEVSVGRDGCFNSDQVTIQVNSPDSLRIDSLNVKDVTCYGAENGQIRIFADGDGAKYQFSLDNGQNYLDNGGLFEGLAPGVNYSIMVMEDSACTIAYPEQITLTEPEENHPLHLAVDSIDYRDVSCYGANNGEIVVYSHGEGLLYEYSIDGGLTYENNGGVFKNLAPGQDFEIMIREDSVCTAIYDETVQFSEPTEIEVNYRLTSPSCDDCSDGQIILMLNGGNDPYSILWSNFETSTRRINLKLGEYSVAVTDANQCRVLKTITLDMGHGSMVLPNAFTPNDDGVNDVWTLEALDNYPEAVVRIFDRFGKLIFESPPGYPVPWDGKVNGEYVAMGTYYFLIKLDGFTEAMPGNLTVVR